MPAYSEYRDSGVPWLGDVPSHWEVARLKILLTEIDERTGEKQFELLGLSKSLGVVRRSELTQGASESDNYAKYKVAQAGSLVMNKMQAWNGVFGLSPCDGMVSPDYSVFRVMDNRHAQFLCGLLRTDIMAGELFTRCRGMGTAFLRLNTSDFFDVKIALPPQREIEQIQSFLDRETAKIDALVAEQARLIALLTEKRQEVISHAVTKGLNANAPMKDSGIQWLGEIPAHWEAKRLRFVADIETGDADTANATDDGEYPFFVRSPNIERINGFTHDCEAVMTAGDGAGVGKVFHHFTGKFRAHQRVYIFRNFRGVTGTWFYEYLKALFYRVVLEGTAKSTVDSLRRPMIADFPITIPNPDEIEPIEKHIKGQSAKFDQLMREAEAAISLLQERRAALISAAVTGKIDVRGVTSQSNVVSIDSARPTKSLPSLRAVIGSFVIPKLGDKGRMAVMKGGYLAEAHCGMNDIGGRYQRYAAGPYDSGLIAAMERGADDLCGIKTIEPPGDGERVVYQVPQSAPPLKVELEALVGEDRANAFNKMLSDLDGIGREGIEAVATVYAVWNDLIAAGKAADDDAICNGVLNDWHEEKRQKFNRIGLDHWLDWMRRHDIVPNGSAPRTDHQGSLFT